MKPERKIDPEIIEQLKLWLIQPGNSKAKLAHLMGYGTSGVIDQWIKRVAVPPYQRERVLAIITKGDAHGTDRN